MRDTAQVLVHESEFPSANLGLLQNGLNRRVLPQKFLYQSHGQTARWVALHRAWSPAQRDNECSRLYQQAAEWAASLVPTPLVHLAGLACGNGHKEIVLASALRARGKTVIFSAVETGLPMALTATNEFAQAHHGLQTNSVLADLPHTQTLPALLRQLEPAGAARILTLFGVVHTFEPTELLPKILNAVRSQDLLLLSLNMAPANSYESSLERILTQYDNPETYAWLEGALLELGFERGDCQIQFLIAESPTTPGLRRFLATAHLQRPRTIEIGGRASSFQTGDQIQLFYSYRYTRNTARELIVGAGLDVVAEFIAANEEEGVFLCRRAAPTNPGGK